jgi:hypothetical protein
MPSSKTENLKKNNIFLSLVSKCIIPCIFLLYPFQTDAQDKQIRKETEPFDLTELMVTVYLQGGYTFEADVLISASEELYYNIEGLFKTLEIKCNLDLNSLVGFISNEKNLYEINFETKIITIGDKVINIQNGLIERFGEKYIKEDLISQAFGLNFVFNPRSLSVKLTANFELLFLKQIRLEKTRNNISKLQGKTITIDTILPRNYHLFKFGTVDWSLNSSQSIAKEGENNNINTTNLSIGSELLFGEANFSLNYSDQSKFDINQIQYNWRWINNDNKLIKQARFGRIGAQNIPQVNSPIIGATINNNSNTVRKASGFYIITDITEPNWKVELYINDVLVDFTEADASGLYVFKVPNVFGYNTLKLKFYGPLGEERTEERTKNTPYRFTPIKTLAYSLTAGILQNTKNTYYSRLILDYGITNFLTITAGLEYLSAKPNNIFVPFAKISFQPTSKLILNLDYLNQENFKGLLNYYITSSTFLEIDYSKRKIAELNKLERIKIQLSTPFKTKIISGLTRLVLQQYRYEKFNYNQINFTFSGFYKQLKFNSSSFANWATANTPQINSALALSYKLKNGMALVSSANYNVTAKKISNVRAQLQMKVLEMNLSASYMRSFLSQSDFLTLSLTYNLPFARLGFSGNYNDQNFNFNENAQGSLVFGGDNTFVQTRNNSAMGKGGILLHPFLDVNQNGTFDKGEKKVLLSSVNVPGATVAISKKDSIVRILDLNAFINYTIEFSDTSLDYISWRFKKKTYQVMVDPNQYKHVFVPIIAVGEISGTVFLKKGKNIEGQGRVNLQIFDEKENKVAETLSEFDGYYSYLGLKTGKYTIRVDPKQLKALNYQSLPLVHEIVIKASEYGNILDNLDFNLID